jgi:hypothetical protein
MSLVNVDSMHQKLYYSFGRHSKFLQEEEVRYHHVCVQFSVILPARIKSLKIIATQRRMDHLNQLMMVL